MRGACFSDFCSSFWGSIVLNIDFQAVIETGFSIVHEWSADQPALLDETVFRQGENVRMKFSDLTVEQPSGHRGVDVFPKMPSAEGIGDSFRAFLDTDGFPHTGNRLECRADVAFCYKREDVDFTRICESRVGFHKFALRRSDMASSEHEFAFYETEVRTVSASFVFFVV